MRLFTLFTLVVILALFVSACDQQAVAAPAEAGVAGTPVGARAAQLAVAASAAFPSTGLLDGFNRANGTIGANWSGATGGYSIASNQLDVGAGGDIYWKGTAFGADQEAYVTFTTIDGAGQEFDLLLKAQSNSTWSAGVIEVWYNPGAQRAQVWTFTSAQNWVQRGADIPLTLVNGDQFGARATGAGQVEVYRNGTLLAARDVTAWPLYASDGYIGLWFIGASNAVLDDFGGGTVGGAPTATVTATSTAAPINTPTPTPTHTATVVASATATNTPLPTVTATRTPSATNPPTATSTSLNTPTATASPASDLIFADGFESGNLAAWSSSSTDAGDLSVSAAALIGSYGLRAVLDDNNSIYVTDDTPNAEPRYRARFYFDPNSITMTSGNAHYLFQGYQGTSTVMVRVEFRFSSGAYQLRAQVRNDSSAWTSTSWFSISDAPHFIEFDWRASTAVGVNNGGVTFWIDGAQQANVTGIDNDTLRTDRVRLGAVSGIDTGTRGTYYFDAFESRRQSYIGPAVGGPTPTPTNTPGATATSSATPTFTSTAPPSATSTPSNTPLFTNTPTATRTSTAIPSATMTAAPINTSGPTATFTPTPTPGGSTALTAQVAASGDDANEDGSSFTTSSSTVWLGNAASTTASYIGLRFANVTIPPGATITSAHLEVYSSQNQWISVSMRLAAEATGNSSAFTTDNRPSQRTLTTQGVNHSSNTQWLANTWYALDEMAAVIREVVNRADWQSGNSLSLILKGTGGAWGRKLMWSYDGSPTNAPKLVVAYTTTNAATSTPTVTAMPSPTSTSAATASSTPTPAVTLTPTQTPITGSPVYFPVGTGGSDVIPHQLVRTSDDRVYLFAHQQYSTRLRAYWTTAAGLPNAQADFAGSAFVLDSANLISVDAVYGGGSLIHVLVNTQGGQLKDYPFDTTANVFKPAITLASNSRTVTGDYAGSSGVSGMVDQSGTLHVAYWATGDHVVHVAYTYDSGANTLTPVSGPTQLDAEGVAANHPSVALSPLDNSLTVAWVSQSSPAKILARTRTSAGVWGGVEIVSTAPVWTSPNFGVNIDQGPSLVIASDGAKHLVYMENYDASGDYGRVHYVVNTGSGWTDQALGIYTHDPAIAINSAGDFYVLGHGHPKNAIAYGGGSPCLDMRDMCYTKKNGDGTWGAPQLLIAHTGASDSFDASVSVKWGVVGWNRPETIEFVFFAILNNNYSNPTIYYARIP